MEQDRIIMIKGGSSNWYEQAIFILRRGVTKQQMPVDLVLEAEKIIEQYQQNHFIPLVKSPPIKNVQPYMKRQNKKKKKSSFDFFLNVTMLAGCFVLAALLAYAVMS